MDGFAWGTDPAEVARAKATVHLARERYLSTYVQFWDQLSAFVSVTQLRAAEDMARWRFPRRMLWRVRWLPCVLSVGGVNNAVLGVELPSNLQGLCECRYRGDELNMTTTMKLFKAFNDFTRSQPTRSLALSIGPHHVVPHLAGYERMDRSVQG